ncbi:hypothetical protein DUNSADRAFT_7323 [Dunaliella salina]|uniref:Putative gamma-glutamylcyclotransferase n=1 Tax=Dunaliella salina TaxID=3046 RepID=A0ABQ7GLR5_DUNSA|nr:hypothetical protein DUNSADRAFT_7323 [Dunaliella salina]|eukprot:KAF5835483.1 hypothetical protein DUNSADRAFT_7323 [Dunaliella salina]
MTNPTSKVGMHTYEHPIGQTGKHYQQYQHNLLELTHQHLNIRAHTGYSRYKVKNAVFPAIVPDQPDKTVQGMVLFDLTPHEQHVLDVYEAEEYYKTSVQALVQGELVPADVYVFKDEFRNQLLPEAWDYAVWKEQHLAKWLSRLAPGNAHPNMDDCAEVGQGVVNG